MVSNFYIYSQSTIISIEFVDFWPKVYLILYASFWKLDNPNCHIVYWTYLSNKSKVPIIQYTYINEIHFYKKVDKLLCHILKLLNSNFFFLLYLETFLYNYLFVQTSEKCPSKQEQLICSNNFVCLALCLSKQYLHMSKGWAKANEGASEASTNTNTYCRCVYLIVSPRSPTP